MSWRVTIDFKRGPSFGSTVQAQSKAEAIAKAQREATSYGWDAPVKKAIAIPT